jgi:hypothetical protein
VLRDRLLQPVPVGTDPNPASRQFTSDIGDESILRTNDEADHSVRVEPFARCDAAAQRTGFVITLELWVALKLWRAGRVRFYFAHPT